jgi:hypothetical protein
MPDMKPCFPAGVVWVWFASDCTAHLAREPIAVKDEGAELFGDSTRKRGERFRIIQQILTRL